MVFKAPNSYGGRITKLKIQSASSPTTFSFKSQKIFNEFFYTTNKSFQCSSGGRIMVQQQK